MRNGFCTVCKGKCPWDAHESTPFRWKWVQVTKVHTFDDMKQRLEIATMEPVTAERCFAAAKAQYERLWWRMWQQVSDIKESTDRLSEIAARPKVLSGVEYIELLIRDQEDSHE